MWCKTHLAWCSVSRGHFHLSPAQHKLQTGVISEAQTLPGTIRWGKFNFSSPNAANIPSRVLLGKFSCHRAQP